MTIREQVIEWSNKYPQNEKILDKALSRADVCDSCEKNELSIEGDKEINVCGVCKCKLLRIAFHFTDNPCMLRNFNEPLPESSS